MVATRCNELIDSVITIDSKLSLARTCTDEQRSQDGGCRLDLSHRHPKLEHVFFELEEIIEFVTAQENEISRWNIFKFLAQAL